MFKRKPDPYKLLFNNTRLIKHTNDAAFIIGDLFEEATARLFRCTRISVNPLEETCPDLVSENKNYYLESKAGYKDFMLRRSQVLKYKDFLRYYFPQVDDPKPHFSPDLYFIFWKYNWKMKEPAYQEVIHESLVSTVEACYILSFDFIYNFIRKFKAINAIRFKPAFLKKHMGRVYDLEIKHLSAYDLDLKPFPLYFNNKNLCL